MSILNSIGNHFGFYRRNVTATNLQNTPQVATGKLPEQKADTVELSKEAKAPKPKYSFITEDYEIPGVDNFEGNREVEHSVLELKNDKPSIRKIKDFNPNDFHSIYNTPLLQQWNDDGVLIKQREIYQRPNSELPPSTTIMTYTDDGKKAARYGWRGEEGGDVLQRWNDKGILIEQEEGYDIPCLDGYTLHSDFTRMLYDDDGKPVARYDCRDNKLLQKWDKDGNLEFQHQEEYIPNFEPDSKIEYKGRTFWTGSNDVGGIRYRFGEWKKKVDKEVEKEKQWSDYHQAESEYKDKNIFKRMFTHKPTREDFGLPPERGHSGGGFWGAMGGAGAAVAYYSSPVGRAHALSKI